MKSLTILTISLLYHTTVAARASIVEKPVFDAAKAYSAKLFNSLPIVQREILMSNLTRKSWVIGKPDVLTGKTVKKIPAKRLKKYKQLLAKHAGKEETTGLLAEQFLRVQDGWKVNLDVIMPRTAALTEKDLLNSTVARHYSFEVATVLDLTIKKHAGIIEAFKKLDIDQTRNVLFKAAQRWQLGRGKELLIAEFSEDLSSTKQDLAEMRQAHGGDKNAIAEREEIKESLEKELPQLEAIASIGEQAAQVEAIAVYYAQEAIEMFDDELVLNSESLDAVKEAVIADLTLAGYAAMVYLGFTGISGEQLSAITTELEAISMH